MQLGSYQLLDEKWLKTRQKGQSAHVLSHVCSLKKKVNDNKILKTITSLCETSFQLSYTMPSTASFSLIECRHFFHWATDE